MFARDAQKSVSGVQMFVHDAQEHVSVAQAFVIWVQEPVRMLKETASLSLTSDKM